MSLATLAQNLQGEVAGGTVSISKAALTSAGLVPRTDLDAVMEGAFGLKTGTPLSLTTPLTIGPPGDTTLTVSGTLAAWNVSALATVVFTANGSAVTFTVSLPLGNGKPWAFTTSFPTLAGFPFQEATGATPDSPTFLFATDGPSAYTWNGLALTLQTGLNYAGLWSPPALFDTLLELLPDAPTYPVPLCGPVDPSVIDRTKRLSKPDACLSAELVTGNIETVGPLTLVDAHAFFESATEPTTSGLGQFTDAGLLTNVLFDDGVKIACRVSVSPATSSLSLLLYADEKTQPSLDALFKTMGGSWYSVVPEPLQELFTDFSLEGVSATMSVGGDKPSLDSLGMSIGSNKKWEVFDGLTIDEISFGWDVLDPLGAREFLAQFSGTCQFLPSVLPGTFYVSITSDLQIGAVYDGTAKLSNLLSGGAEASNSAHPIDFDLVGVEAYFDIPAKSFSLGAQADAAVDFLGDGKLMFSEIRVSYARTGTNTSASLSGGVTIGSVPLALDAEYADGGWTFSGGLAAGASLSIAAMVNQLCKDLDLPDFVPGDLELSPFQLELDVPPAPAPRSYSVDAGLSWKFSAGALQNVEVDAKVDLKYDGGKGTYTGSVGGETKLAIPAGPGGEDVHVDVILTYELKPNSKDLIVEWPGFAKATYTFPKPGPDPGPDADTIRFQIEATSIGSLLSELIGFVEDDPTFSLPAPWDLLNDIPLAGFDVLWSLKPKPGVSPIQVDYTFSSPVNLFFVEIDALSLTTVDGKVMMGLTFTLLGDPKGKQTQTFPPSDPPKVPGNDTTTFELDLLALGQHVTIPALAGVTSVSGAIDKLSQFTPPTKPDSVPVQPNAPSTQPNYAADSQWLVGTEFKVLVDKNTGVALLDLQAVFNDPILYGLRVVLGGPKAGILGGLDFEIIYRKISDTVGLYEIVLTLPTAMSHMEFGEVSISLPRITVDVYTNGDFRVDFGFPANMDFSHSFGIEAFPFTGQGGFYFGVLSNATAPNLPATTLGRFDPVIVFGIGLQVGLGKSIDEGIFSAQISVSVFGIVEGVVAPWHPYADSGSQAQLGTAAGNAVAPVDETYYYWLQGTIGVVAKLSGEVNFAIISASVSVTVQAYVQMTIEAHRAIPVHMEAGVSVEISLSINLGLFSITIHLSYSVTITADFTIGSDSHAPWDSSGIESPRAFAELGRGAPRELVIPALRPLTAVAKQPLALCVAPQLTLADWAPGGKVAAAYVVGLFVDGPVGSTEDTTTFETLAYETLLWAIASFGDWQPDEPLVRAAVVGNGFRIDQVQDAFNYFSADGDAPPLTYANISDFLQATFSVSLAPATGLASAVALPMIPDLVLDVPAWGGSPRQSIDFSTNANCTPAYLVELQKLLEQLTVDLETPLQRQQAPVKPKRPGEPVAQSLATFVFEDYFALLCRHMLQAALDGFDSYSYKLTGGETLAGIVNDFDAANDLTAAALGAANANLPLAANAQLTVNGATHAVLANESLTAIARAYGSGTTADALGLANKDLAGLLVPGKTIVVGAKSPLIGPHDTLASIASSIGAALEDVIAAVAPLTDVLVPLAILSIPPFFHVTGSSETLGTVAAAYGTSIAQLATDNSGLAGLFETTVGKTFVAIRNLSVLTADQIHTQLHDAQVYANLAGISTRFVLNGLRLPVTDNVTIPSGSPCAGQANCGLQSLIGQQVTLPALADTDAGNYALTLAQGGGGAWIAMPSGATSMNLAIDKAQIDAINGVLAAAASFVPDTLSIQALPETAGVARRFALPTAIPVQLPGQMTLPDKTQNARVNVFPLPDALLSVLAQPAQRPTFSLQLGTPRPTGGMATNPATSFGWATLVSLTVKRASGAPATPMSPGTYELVGTDPTGIVLLERLLQAGPGAVASVQILYPPNAAAALSQGLIGGDPGAVSTFIVQSNLSTASAPQGGAVRDEATLRGAETTPVAGDATAFVRTLWECSIVQSGGFALYYESSQGSPGLPDDLFDATGTAKLQLLVLLNDGSAGLGEYVNAVTLGDAIDTSRTTVFAQSEPRPVTIQAAAGDSLASLAGQVHLTPSELAVALGNVPLALGTGASLAVADAVYETRAGDTLDALAGRFATPGPAIQELNASLGIDWSSIPAWTLLAIPASEYALVSGAQFTTLAAVAANFGLSVAALGALNKDAPIFGAGALPVTDEIVDATAVLPPGAAGFEVTRQQLSGDPSSVPGVYLDSIYHLLGYQLADNPGFKAGPMGLPVSPGDPLDPDQIAKQAEQNPPPPIPTGPATLYYERLLPLAANAKYNPLAGKVTNLPDPAANPYAGVGYSAQPLLEWRDLFGNRARTPLSDPTMEPQVPQNMPPVPLRYSDVLLGLAQWPNLSAEYTVASGPELTLEIRVDVSRYAGAGSAGPAQQAAQAARQTYAQVYYQLNQTRADGTPHVTMSVSTTLDGGAAHGLSGGNLTNVQGLALTLWRYLDGILSGSVPEQTNPFTTSVTVPVEATNSADIFQLSVYLTISRDPSLVADESRDEAGVAFATTVVPPQLGPDGSTAALLNFATSFESTFSSGATQLKLGVGDSREGAAGSAEARLLWAVRTSTDLSAGVSAKVTGAPVFWAPPPLSTVPISRNHVGIAAFDPDKGLDPGNPTYHDYTNVDLDVSARQALAAIDRFLSPTYATPAFVVDARAGATYLDRLRAAKATIAAAIAGSVDTVLTTPEKPADPQARTDACSKWQQQMLVTLASAYSVDVAVQLPIATRGAVDPGFDPPALYGHPALSFDNQGGNAAAAPPYSASPFEAPLRSDKSWLTFLFTANDPTDAAAAKVGVELCLDQIEHQIGDIGVPGYEASTWLTFPIPLSPIANASGPTLEVPIVLRAYPDPPTLSAQSATQALDTSTASKLVQSATQWTYMATYNEQHAAQDVTEATPTFNVAPAGVRANFEAGDVFDALSNLLALLPQLQPYLDQDLAQLTTATAAGQQLTRATNTVDAFTQLVETLAATWPRAAGSGIGDQDGGDSGPYTFTIAESRYPDPGGPDLLVTIADGETPRPTGVPEPVLVFDGYEPVTTDGGVRYQSTKNDGPNDPPFLGWEQARLMPSRQVAIGPLDVFAFQNAELGVRLLRNVGLVKGNPTCKPFVYKTPLVVFSSVYTPLLAVGETIDVALIGSTVPVQRTLAEHLGALFSAFLASATDMRELKVQTGFSYPVGAVPPVVLPDVEVPIVFAPAAKFVVPDDWAPSGCTAPITADSPFVCRLAQVIKDWVSANQPTQGGKLVFDVAAYSSLGQGTLPLVDLSGFELARSNVTDL